MKVFVKTGTETLTHAMGWSGDRDDRVRLQRAVDCNTVKRDYGTDIR